MKSMRHVVHFGPIDNRGGMASLIRNMLDNVPDGWLADIISTSGNILSARLEDGVHREENYYQRSKKAKLTWHISMLLTQ